MTSPAIMVLVVYAGVYNLYRPEATTMAMTSTSVTYPSMEICERAKKHIIMAAEKQGWAALPVCTETVLK